MSVVRLESRASPGPHWPRAAESKTAEPPVLFRGKKKEKRKKKKRTARLSVSPSLE